MAIDILHEDVYTPQTLTQGERGGIPPKRPVGLDIEDHGMGDDDGELLMFVALDNIKVEDLPGLDGILSKYRSLLEPAEPMTKAEQDIFDQGRKRFIKTARAAGLIKRKPGLNLGQYIGALLPGRKPYL